MRSRAKGRALRAVALLGAALAATGCQGLSGPGAPGIDLDRAMPGKIARARHAHVTDALAALGRSLSGERAGLGDVAFDATLVGEMPAESLHRLAERELIDAGPYRLVGADTSDGRLEYRSERTGQHLSVIVRAPDEREGTDGRDFVVTDVFGQASLAELARTPSGAPSAATLTGAAALSAVRGPSTGDAARLARLDGLPAAERDREDLLGLRAMLALRLGRDAAARSLVERGIVRYPDSPLHFALAERLFERAGEPPPAALSTLVRERFGRGGIEPGRRTVASFLADGAGS